MSTGGGVKPELNVRMTVIGGLCKDEREGKEIRVRVVFCIFVPASDSGLGCRVFFAKTLNVR